ncbi:Upstream activation factor subunit spp27 [Colletotrichum sidae]|uniref:Upstream activation factor subunit spp27 n=3 Tax=Colletotrichum orbiculare species complex TaxID=2707354 RepID=N4UTP8_COLOR|nr:Upstream activation factor subunit spp27 [Colletotrichum orbiculare MAFF 240422]TDZ36041.1 Upstream activation factor subunit spp27 [Colletotrichum spinosum]TEA12741.1 Upstream activation factor subunit spp27 [Colletotrichum sidae]
MSLPLTAGEESQYTSIIDAILATADLTTITRKKVRLGLERSLGGKDLSDQKDAIKALIEERFDAISGASQDVAETNSASPAPKREANGYDEDEGDGEIQVSVSPVRKKQKREDSSEDADAKLAAELQAQENRMARGRTTRGGNGASSKPKKKAAPKKKSAKKVRDEDDSDVEGSDAPKRKAGGGFQKPFNLSESLSELLGEPQLSRPQVVKKLWQHIKANELQDPGNKRQIICDDKMQAIFKLPKVDMFQMNKLIGSHLYPVEEQ